MTDQDATAFGLRGRRNSSDPFSDDTSTSRDTAFAKIQARVLGTELAEKLIGGG